MTTVTTVYGSKRRTKQAPSERFAMNRSRRLLQMCAVYPYSVDKSARSLRVKEFFPFMFFRKEREDGTSKWKIPEVFIKYSNTVYEAPLKNENSE